jgi:hypothetical protein
MHPVRRPLSAAEFVDIHIINGVFTPDQKSEIITKVTDAMMA